MGVGEGVPLNELHCPTCGERFTDYNLHVDSEEEFTVSQIVADIKASPAHWRRYLLCPQGHRWTVKTIWRITNHPGIPDRVLLGEFLG